MKISLLANGLTGSIPLDDAYDICYFLEATGRTIPRSQWAEESIAVVRLRQNENMF